MDVPKMLFVADLGASHEGQDTSHMRLQPQPCDKQRLQRKSYLTFFSLLMNPRARRNLGLLLCAA